MRVIIYKFTLLILLTSSTAFVLANGYTVESTRNKLIANYPKIQTPSLPNTPAIEVQTHTYKTLDKRQLSLDLYQINTDSNQALLVLIHGGGWRSGSKELLAPLAQAIAQHGISVASLEYRLSGEAPFPAGFEDGRDAILWLKSNAKKLGIDANKVAIAGGSAGGQLAALLAYSGGKLDNESGPRSFVVQALINIDGLSDFTSEEALPFENDPKKNPSSAGAWFGGRYEEVPQLWKRGSPYFYIDEHSPPTLFINSDQTRFRAGRDAAIKKLNSDNITTKIVFFENSPHAFWHFEPWFSPTLKACVDFLEAQM